MACSKISTVITEVIYYLMKKEIFLTEEGISTLKIELEHLVGSERKKIAERLRSAIQMGDLSENADYIKAKEDQSFIEGRILELEETLKQAVVIDKTQTNQEMIQIGSKVVVKEIDFQEETIYIVGSKEADPASGKISYESPIGSALLNHHVGDIVRVETPAGGTNFKVIEIK